MNREQKADAYAASYDAAYLDYVHDTRLAFLDFYAGKYATVDWYGHSDREMHTEAVSEALLCELSEREPSAAFFSVLRKSDCPHVAALKLALMSGYIERHADAVAKARAEA